MEFAAFTQKSIEETFADLKTSAQGLAAKEVLARQKEYGFNEIKLGTSNAFTIFLRQVKSPFFYLICGAGVIAFFLGEMIDGLVIVATAIINISIGFFQEYRAEKTIFLLRKYIAQNVKVLRVMENNNGEGKCRQVVIEKKMLVPGDIVLLEPGDVAPADLRAIELESFLVDESFLTGESVPVVKQTKIVPGGAKEIFKASNMLFAGSSVVAGKAKGVVVGTGQNTAFGDIAKLVSGARKPSAYEKNIIYFCRLVLKIVVVTIVLMFAANIFLKGFGSFFHLALFSIALIISILPEALPAVVTFALAKGSMKMAKHHVVVRRLSAIEDLGNIEILCTDKTGTITENKLTLEKIVSSDREKCLVYGLLRDDASRDGHENVSIKKVLNPFDIALLARASPQVRAEARRHAVLAELPFDSNRMRASLLVCRSAKESLLVVKGAPEVILKLCSKFGPNADKKEIVEEVSREGQSGKRVLALAIKKMDASRPLAAYDEKLEKGLTFLGYFVFEDPLKNTAGEAIRLSKKLGVQIKIITGDSKEVAGYIGKKTGLVSQTENVILGEDMVKMPADDFDEACVTHNVFARISPETKYAILKSLQKTKEVGFLGEGINDAPALKIANVGIAVPSASDISREVADVVMLQKDLRVIVEGIKEGRTIFANINKYIKSTLISNFGNFYSVAIISLFVNYLPMLPVQILLGNLLSDFPLVSIATDSVDAEELRKPKLYQIHMILPLIIMLGLVSTLFDFIFFMLFKNHPPATIQTLWFVASMLTEFGLIYSIRTRHVFWKAKKPALALSLLTVFAVGISLVLPFIAFGQNVFHFVAVPFSNIFVVIALAAVYFAVSEIAKLIYFHYWKLQKTAALAAVGKNI
ncbi:MAG TPA: cation-transporting P-type ATPase [Negativicutes bacterium]|nr:cation-transporting P-type ATPase [Negativicutes bacterium]